MVLKGPGSHPDRLPLRREDWVFLNANDRICVRWENHVVNYGTVDVVAPDASVIWLWLDSGRGRVALHEDDSVSVWFEEERPWLSREPPTAPPTMLTTPCTENGGDACHVAASPHPH